MVSIGNKAKLVDSKFCMTCGKCCIEFNMTTDLNCALRFMWVAERKIKTEDTPFNLPYEAGNEKNIKFKFPCSQLVCKLKERTTNYQCAVWDKERPDFCNTYPDHIFYGVEIWNTEKILKILQYESKNCPALKDVTVEQVQKMLGERA
jgi:hypothetical protein